MPVWGTAGTNTEVTVTFAGQTKSVIANAAGRWQATLDPLMASAEPRELVVKSGPDTVTIRDVVVGEVWICSGQSNMVWPVHRSADSEAITKQASQPLIRLAYIAGDSRCALAAADRKSPWFVTSPDVVGDFSAVAYAFGLDLRAALDVPVGLVLAAASGTPVETWLPPGPPLFGRPVGAHFKAAIEPLIPFAIRGAIWYQGESNAVNAERYGNLLATLINEWRNRWREGAKIGDAKTGDEFPFYIVQISNYGRSPEQPTESRLAQVREAQLKISRTLPNAGLALAIDGDGDIHPREKSKIGGRLAKGALAKTYGRSIECSGPVYESAARDGASLVLSFSQTTGGLVAAGGGPLKQFAIAGEDRVFHWATATVEGEKLRVSSPAVAEPAAVRYAWADNPTGCNLTNAAGLPASPFRTDDWPLAVAIPSATRLTNKVLQIELSPEHGGLVVTDLRTKKVWQQAWLEKDISLQHRLVSLDAKERVLTLECGLAGISADGKSGLISARVSMKLHPTQPDVEVSIEPTKSGTWRQAAYPYAFACDGERVSNLFPHGEGMLVPVRKNDPDWIALPDGALYGGVHSYLMCLGLVDESTGEGLLTLAPDIEATNLRWREVLKTDQTIVVPQVIDVANKGVFDRPLQMTFCFSNAGGYVALASRYREFFAQQGLHTTLVEKAAANPALATIAGAPIVWAASRSPEQTRQMADTLAANGVSRCLFGIIEVGGPKPGPEYRTEMAATVKHVRGLGYQVYQYDQYRDAFKLDPTKGHHFQLNTDAWPDMIVRRENGSMISAFGPESGVVCSDFFLPLARKHFDDTFNDFDYSAWFLDCLGSVGFNAEAECHAPGHPCDRYDTRRERIALLAEVNRRGKLASTECGIDYLLPHLHWVEGGTTLVRWVGSLERRQSPENDSINAAGGMKASAVLEEIRKLPPNATPPRTVSISTRYRIPFYSLCHHDEVIQTWRWEDGMEQQPVYWQWKNLWTVLYGAAPMYRIFAPELEKWKEEIGRTDLYVGSFVRDVAFDAMTTHRCVTTDRLVQETEFSSGRGVVVNFGDTDQTLSDGQLVRRRDYVSFHTTPAGRAYAPPPCPNVFAD
ncbi:MAG: glycoside hydrolase [Planctomycetia bacterium]